MSNESAASFSAADLVQRIPCAVFPLVLGEKFPQARKKWTMPEGQSAVGANGTKYDGIQTRTPPAALTHYGVVLGEYIVFDLDNKHGKTGSDNFKKLRAHLPAGVTLPPSLTVRTPSGGYHVYYRTPTPLATRTDAFPSLLGPLSGVDIKADRSYVVGPGSELPNGSYTISKDAPVAELSAATVAWLLEYTNAALPAQAPEKLKDPYGRVCEALPYIPPTEDYHLWIQVGYAMWGATQGSQDGLDAWAEWSSKAVNAASYEKCERLWNEEFHPHSVGAEYIYALAEKNGFRLPERMDALLADTDFVAEAQAAETLEFEEHTLPKNLSRLEWIEADGEEIETDTYVVDGIIPAHDPHSGTVGLLIGVSRAGKSTLVSHLAASLASGRPFFGKQIDQAGGTLIFAAEDTKGHRRRIKAERIIYGTGDDPEWPIMQYQMAGERKALKHFADWAANIADEARSRFFERGHALRLLVIDTLSAALIMQDENDNREMAEVVAVLRKLSLAAQCPVLLVHHTGKAQGSGARGGSALSSNVDFHMTADATVDERSGVVSDRLLALTKTRDGECGPIGPYDIAAVHIGHNAITGRTISAPYIIEQTMVEHKRERARRKPDSEAVVSLIASITGLSDVAGAAVDAVAAFEATVQGKDLDRRTLSAEKKRFGRALSHLLEQDRIECLTAGGEKVPRILEKGADARKHEATLSGWDRVISRIRLLDG